MSMDTLVALCDILECTPNDLIKPEVVNLQVRNTRYIREVLVTTSAPLRRQENLARLKLWVKEAVTNLPSHQARIIGPFAEWNVVRDARRRATRGRYTSNAAAGDRTDIRTAIEFLIWLDTRDLELVTLRQEDVDLWLTTYPTRRRGLASFIRWTVARRLTSKLTVPPKPKTLPSHFLDEDEYSDQLRRCLNDDALPLEVRIAGALIMLYALPATRIVELTTDRLHHEDDGVYLTLDRHPVLLPPKLARLIEQQPRARDTPPLSASRPTRKRASSCQGGHRVGPEAPPRSTRS